MKAKNGITRQNKVHFAEQAIISAEDREKIWQAIDAGDHDAEAAIIIIYTGMRVSELLEVEKNNFDLSARMLVVGKKTEARRIPIHSCIVPFVTRLMQTEGDFLMMRYDGDHPAEMTLDYFQNYIWKSLTKRLDIGQYTVHAGRHTCLTMMRNAGIDDDVCNLIIGHRRADIADRYIHYSDEILVEEMDKVTGR